MHSCSDFSVTIDGDKVQLHEAKPNANVLIALYVQRAIRQLDNLNGHEACYVPDNVIEFLENHRS